MARRIPLKVVMIANGPNGPGPAPFHWGEMLQVILKSANPTKGLTMDEVLVAVDAMKPLDKAISEGAEYVTFNETQYRLLREKLDSFAFGIATPEVAEFGLAVRDAKEIT